MLMRSATYFWENASNSAGVGNLRSLVSKSNILETQENGITGLNR